MLQSEKLPGFNEECVLVTGVVLVNLPGPGEPTILYIQPCASVEGKINCEFRLGLPGEGASEGFFDFPVLSRILSTYGDKFAETRISSNLGVARIQWHGKKITISKNGRIIIRESTNEEDAKATIEFLSRLLAPSIFCARCGEVLLNCAVASCDECGSKQAFFTSASRSALWSEEVRGIRSLITVLDEIRDSLYRNIELGEALKSFESLSAQCYRASQLTLDLIVQSDNREELAVGILILRFAWDLSLILELLDQVRRYKSSNDKTGLSLLNAIGLWLLALRGSVDGISDKGARERSIGRWARFYETRNIFYQEAENKAALKMMVDSLTERWPASRKKQAL